MVVTYAAGGITDSLARAVAGKMTESMGQQVIVDNRVGGSGNIGSALVAKAAPDGYTILFGANGPQAANVSLFAKLPYDPMKDLTQVALVGISGVVLVVAPNSPYNNLQDLISAAKAKPGSLSFGSSGAGGTPHLAGESLKSLASLDMIHVPYKGDAPSVVDVMGGQVTMAFPGTGSAAALVRGGKLKALAVSSARRSEALPSVPTFAETVPGYELVGWFGIFLPAGASPDVVAVLHREALKAVNDPKIREQFVKLGVDVPEPALSPSQFREFQQKDIARLGAVIQQAKVKLD
ncbi:MAG: tripartite tricarboxylate transporter substrate binding protein [Pseudomonadota bacterium]